MDPFRQMTFATFDHQPGDRQGSFAVYQTDHQSNAALPHIAAIDDKHQFADRCQSVEQLLDKGQVVAFVPIRSFWIHRLYRLNRLSSLARSGAFQAMVGSWQLLPSTMPLTNAASVVSMRMVLLFGSPGYNCMIACRMVRYTRRLSLMVSLLFFRDGKNVVYLKCQSSFDKMSGIQIIIKLYR